MKRFNLRFFLGLLTAVILTTLINTKVHFDTKVNNRGAKLWTNEEMLLSDAVVDAAHSSHKQQNSSANKDLFKKKSITALYRGWTNKGNIGDNILAELINALMGQKLAERGFGFIMVDDYKRCHEPWSDSHFDMFILGGGSLIAKVWLCDLQDSSSWNKPILIPGSGYDDYSCQLSNETMYDEFKQGKVQTLTKMDNSTMLMFEKMINSHQVIGGVRGPFTYQMLLNGMKTSTSLPEIGDVAHLTAQFYGTDPKFDVYEKYDIPQDEQYIVVNMAKRGGSYELKNGLVEAEMIKALHQLGKRYHILFYPMCIDDVNFVRNFAAKIGTEDSKAFGSHGDKRKTVKSIPKLLDIPKIGSMVKGAFFTINYLLHANYISAAYETPFIPLIYRMKVLDLVGSMNFWDYSVKMHNITSEIILNKVDKLIIDRNIIVEKLKAQNKKVSTNLESTFAKMAAVVTSQK